MGKRGPKVYVKTVEQRCRESEKKKLKRNCSVNIGEVIEKWKRLKDLLQINTDQEFSDLLLTYFLTSKKALLPEQQSSSPSAKISDVLEQPQDLHRDEKETCKETFQSQGEQIIVKNECLSAEEASLPVCRDATSCSSFTEMPANSTTFNSSSSEQKVLNSPTINAIRGLPISVPFTVNVSSPSSYVLYTSTAYILMEYSALNLGLPAKPLCIVLKENEVEVLDSEVTDTVSHEKTQTKCGNTYGKSTSMQRKATPSIRGNETKESDKAEEFPTSLIHYMFEKYNTDLIATLRSKGDLIRTALNKTEKDNSTCKAIEKAQRGKIVEPDAKVVDNQLVRNRLKEKLKGKHKVDNDTEQRQTKVETSCESKSEYCRKSPRTKGKGCNYDDSAFDELETCSDDETICSDNNEEITEEEEEDISHELDKELKSSCDSSDSHVIKEQDTSNGKKKKRKLSNKDPDFDPKYNPVALKALKKKRKRKKLDNTSRSDDNIIRSTSVNQFPPLSKNSSQEPEEYEDAAEKLIRKRLERIEKRKNRIKVKLDDHEDKFYEEEVESIHVMDRGKSKEEKTSLLLVCALCRKYKTENRSGLENHIECHVNGDFDCKVCETKFGSSFNLYHHMNQIHKKFDKFKCSECLEMFGGKRALEEHLRSVHDKPVNICEHCSTKDFISSFPSRQSLRDHFLQIHKDKMEKCHKCDKYYLRTMIKRHVWLCDSYQEDVPCEICGKVLKKYNLQVHVKRVHYNQRLHCCPHCDYAAKCGAKLSLHIKARHEDGHSYHCDQCDYTCVQKCQLMSHMRTHTGEKPYKCTQCSYSAAWNVQLKEHKRLHGQPCTVSCDQCGVLVKNERCLILHKKKEHGVAS